LIGGQGELVEDRLQVCDHIDLSYQILVYNVYMPRRLSIPAHRGVDALESHYRRAEDPVARRHWQVILKSILRRVWSPRGLRPARR
jgi:hypothetical protein